MAGINMSIWTNAHTIIPIIIKQTNNSDFTQLMNMCISGGKVILTPSQHYQEWLILSFSHYRVFKLMSHRSY